MKKQITATALILAIVSLSSAILPALAYADYSYEYNSSTCYNRIGIAVTFNVWSRSMGAWSSWYWMQINVQDSSSGNFFEGGIRVNCPFGQPASAQIFMTVNGYVRNTSQITLDSQMGPIDICLIRDDYANQNGNSEQWDMYVDYSLWNVWDFGSTWDGDDERCAAIETETSGFASGQEDLMIFIMSSMYQREASSSWGTLNYSSMGGIGGGVPNCVPYGTNGYFEAYCEY